MTDAELNLLGIEIDQATDTNNELQLKKLRIKIDEFLKSGDTKGEHYVILSYWKSNIFSALYNITENKDNNLLEMQLCELRSAISHRNFSDISQQNKVQIRTNLANALTNCGRYPEALEHYDDALKIMPNYGLTLANRARCLIGYARISNDVGHQQILLRAAQSSFFQAAKSDTIYETVHQIENLSPEYYARAEGLASGFDANRIDRAFKANEKSLGRSKDEQKYRLYCLENRLFLNPINDAYNHPISAADPISISNLSKHIDESNIYPPIEFSLFNRIKQEFVTARYHHYEALTTSGLHFSDKNVKLSFTYDYTLHGIAFEKLRVAFRTAYSILDRVALLINEYWDLGHKATSISFADVWYKNRNSNQLHEKIITENNIALKALFELSKDLHSSKRASFAEPDARLLSDLRNALEHRFVEITDDYSGLPNDFKDVPKSSRIRIPLTVLENRTLRMLRFARSACLYLPLAINLEEQAKDKKDRGFLVAKPISDVRDYHKRRWY